MLILATSLRYSMLMYDKVLSLQSVAGTWNGVRYPLYIPDYRADRRWDDPDTEAD